MLPFGWAGAQHSQSPIDAQWGGDATTMHFRVPEPLVNIAHMPKVNLCGCGFSPGPSGETSPWP
jgi:hypothetical protein